jgi:hypothetical protein
MVKQKARKETKSLAAAETSALADGKLRHPAASKQPHSNFSMPGVVKLTDDVLVRAKSYPQMYERIKKCSINVDTTSSCQTTNSRLKTL